MYLYLGRVGKGKELLYQTSAAASSEAHTFSQKPPVPVLLHGTRP
jgi:hypothetical protein